MTQPKPRSPIAVVGVSALFPGSSDVAGFWHDVLAGTDLVTDVPASHWLIEDYYDPDPSAPDKTYARRGAFLSPVEFDPLEHGIPPNVVPATDTSQLLALILARKVLDDATQGRFDSLDRDRVSVILGLTSAQELLVEAASRLQRPVWVKALREQGLPESEVQQICDRIADSYTPWQENTFPGLLGNVVAGRIANRLNLGGTNCVTDAACASTFSALQMGVSELWLGDSDMVITGGVETFNDIFMFMCFSKTPALSRSGRCRPFDAQADGTMLGEGLGFVALRRLEDAERDGNRIYAVIRGVGSSSDGRARSVYAPLPQGQAKALRRAYAQAGYGPESVELMEAHGTGTKAGDVAEFQGLREVFGETGRTDPQWCALGTVKSQIGHTKAAAGAAGLVKAVMALRHGVLPPTINVDAPHPGLEIGSSPFYLNTQARPWIRDSRHPRRASVSSFGFGGSNFHVALEEYRGPGARPELFDGGRDQLVVAGADSPAALAERCRQLRAAADDTSLAGLARRSQHELPAKAPARAAVVAASVDELRSRLADVVRHVETAPDTPLSRPDGVRYAPRPLEGAVAFVFPGQGSQYVNMSAALAMRFERARAVWDAAADVALGDEPLHRRVFPPPAFDDAGREAQAERLTATEWAQPALGAASVSFLRVLEALGVAPAMLAGHSFGELTALHAAGAFDLETLLRLARARGEAMAGASETPGAMLAVSHPVEALRELIAPWGDDVVVANLNSPRQVVLSGAAAAIDAVAARLRDAGVSARRLPVSTAFHSRLVADAVPALRAALDAATLAGPTAPVYGNADVTPYPATPEAVRERLARQLVSPVRFAEQVEAMYAAGARVFVEVGPGSVLSGLVSDVLGARPHAAVALDRKGRAGLASLWSGLGSLVVAGVPVALPRLWEGVAAPAERTRSERPTLSITGANYAKPYPPPGGAAALPAPNAERAATALAPEPASPATLPASGPAGGPVAVSAWHEMQRQTAEAHAAYQRAMAESHEAFLRASEAAFNALAALTGGGIPASVLDGPTLPREEPARLPPPPLVPLEAKPAPAPAPPARQPHPAEAAVAEAKRPDLGATVLSVVAEKTGYPADMLGLDMELEADLGIDSIKRVEILSALQERVSDLPSVAASEMGTLRTLGQIVARLQETQTAGGPAPAETTAPATKPAAPLPGDVDAPPPAATPSGESLASVLLATVAEKTGYPADMLGLDMELEADLGIDSIKRVEILSALQERVSDLPSVAASEMGTLRTLEQIVARLTEAGTAGHSTQAEAVAPATKPATTPAKAGAPADEATPPAPTAARESLAAVLLATVAEKTGYPADMLGLDMELEADLGIDSIKRVEILSALQERVGDLPSVAASEMGTLRTLGQIVARLTEPEPAGGPAGSEAAPAEPTAAETPATEAVAAAASQEPTPATPRAAPPQAPARVVMRHVPHLREARPAGLAMPGLYTSGPLAITDDGAGVASALAAALEAEGVPARVVEAVPAGCRALVLLDGLHDVSTPDAALALQREAFLAARRVAPAMTEGGLFVTVQDTGGDFGLAGSAAGRAWLGGFAGLAKTAAYEWPAAGVKAIDLKRANRSAEALGRVLADELLRGGPEREVALRGDGTRYAVATRPGGEVGPARQLSERPVVVVSGGARGVTAACLVELARRRPLRVALLGRTPVEPEPEWAIGADDEAALGRACLEASRHETARPVPAELRRRVRAVLAAREVRNTLDALRAAGSEVDYRSLDVRDPAAVRDALDSVRRDWGPPEVLIHAAGVLADKLIAEKFPEQFDLVFGTKTRGLRALLDATRDDALRFIGLFSSVAARSGNPGQADYAMANEVLNKVAAAEAARRGEGCVVRSWNWGPWDGGMVDAALRRHFEQRGIGLIPLDEGARAFADDVLRGAGPVEVVLGVDPSGKGLALPSVHEVALDVRVDATTHPWLRSHQLRGTPVLPVVLVAEWFARAAAACRPDLVLAACSDLRVLRGIRLEDFERRGATFRVRCREVTNGSGAILALELRGSNEALHYAANVEMADRVAPATGGDAKAPHHAEAPWSLDEVYDALLFHGPDFRIIRQLEGVDAEGARAQLSRVADVGWSGGPWRLDPAALDGALQLAIVWGVRTLGRATLPTRLGRLVLHATPIEDGPLTCVLRPRSSNDQHTVCDLLLRDAAGAPVAEMLEVEMHAIPEGATSALEPASGSATR